MATTTGRWASPLAGRGNRYGAISATSESTLPDGFTVVGIGDMSTDAFGCGMLLSPHVRLVGAFNDDHVFLDPRPDPEASFAERRRLFELPASSWRDYDTAVISEGGGVFARSAEQIPLSPQVRETLAVDPAALPPDELIRALLRAPVDLLWNGGVGMFVKAAIAEQRRGPVTRATTACGSTEASFAAGSSRKPAARASPRKAESTMPWPAGRSTPTRSTAWAGSTAQITK